MPPKKFTKNDNAEGSKNTLAKSIRWQIRGTVTVQDIANKSGIKDKWLPYNGDEMDGLLDVLAPLSKEVDEYITQDVGGVNPHKAYFTGDNAIIPEYIDEAARKSYIDDTTRNGYAEMFYGEVNQNQSYTKEVSMLFHTVWKDMEHALNDNEFFKKENLEKNLSDTDVKFIEDLKEYIAEQHEPESPDIPSINRIIDFKHALLSIIDSFDPLNKDQVTSRTKYIKAQKNMYDMHQKYKLVKKNNPKALQATEEKLQETIANAITECHNYFKDIKDDMQSKLSKAVADLETVKVKKYLRVFTADDSKEYTNMLNSLHALKEFTDNKMQNVKFDKEQFHAATKKLKEDILAYIGKIHPNKDEELGRMVSEWKQGHYTTYKLDDTNIARFVSKRGTTHGQVRMETALNLLRELNDNENFNKAPDCLKSHFDEMRGLDVICKETAKENEEQGKKMEPAKTKTVVNDVVQKKVENNALSL